MHQLDSQKLFILVDVSLKLELLSLYYSDLLFQMKIFVQSFCFARKKLFPRNRPNFRQMNGTTNETKKKLFLLFNSFFSISLFSHSLSLLFSLSLSLSPLFSLFLPFSLYLSFSLFIILLKKIIP